MGQLLEPLFTVRYLFLLVELVSDKAETQNEGLGFLIFFAILLHKAPAALGFGTFL